MTRIVLATLFAATVIAADPTPAPVPDGMPFGRIEDADVDRLQDFAVKHGFDLKTEMARVYCCDKKIDKEALARFFVFSRQFNTLDKDARTYGQIIYSSLLRIGEILGVDYMCGSSIGSLPTCSSVCEIFFITRCCASPRNSANKSKKKTARCIRLFSRKVSSSATMIRFSQKRPNQSLQPTAGRFDVQL